MIGFLTYMAIGAILMFFTFNFNKFREDLPTIYINYTIDSMANKGVEPFSEPVFRRALIAILFLGFLLVWPYLLIRAIIRLVSGEK